MLAALASANVSVGNTEQTGQTVSVIDFGADSTGKADSTNSVANAINHLITTGARILFFPFGTYKLSSAPHVALSFAGYSNFQVVGSDSTLLMGSDALCFALDRCNNVTIRDLTIDWDPLPFTQGLVVASGVEWFEVRIDAGFPVPANPAILAIDSYDRRLRNVARKVLEVSGDRSIRVLSLNNGVLRVQVSRILPIPVGTVVVLRFKGNHDGIRITHSQKVSFSRVSLLSSYSMGYNISFCADLAFSQCVIAFKPNSMRLVSTNADGMHITNCSGGLAIDNCVFQGMGDDAINVNTSMWQAQQQPNGRGAVLVSKSGSPLSGDEAPKPGDQLEVLDPRDLHVLPDRTPNPPSTTSIEGNISSGSFVSDLTRIPVTRVTRCHFLGNHSRGILAHAHLLVSNCFFQNISMSAIMIAPDTYWMEGPTTQDVVIDSNRFTGCHYQSSDPEGTVTVDLQQSYGRRPTVPRAIAHNVRITNNTFMDCPTSAISCRSIRGLLIAKNQIGRTWVGGASQPAIAAAELTDSLITENTSTAVNTIVVQDCLTTRLSGNHGFS